MKKQWSLRVMGRVAAFMGCVLLFCSCKHVDGNALKKGDSSILNGKKITFLTSQNQYFDEYSLMAAAMKEKYDCDVEFQVVPDNEYASFLKLKLATTEVPDVFEYNCPVRNREIEASKYCMDLSNEPWVKRLVNKEGIKDTGDGKIYAMPKESIAGYLAVYYNEKVMEQCGIVNPHPKTYREFLEILETVKTNGDGVVPLYETNADVWTTQIFMSSGLPIVLGDRALKTFQKLQKNQIKWTEIPELKRLLIQYNELIKREYVNDNQASASYKSAIEMIGTGKAAMYLTTETCAADIMAKYPGCRLGAFVIPYGNKDILPVSRSVTGLFVPKDGVQTGVTRAFLEAWSMPEIQNIYFFRQGSFNAFNDTKGGKIIDCLQQLNEDYVTAGNYIYTMNDQMSECSIVFEELWKEYARSAAGDITPKEAIQNFQDIYEDYMEKQGEMRMRND